MAQEMQTQREIRAASPSKRKRMVSAEPGPQGSSTSTTRPPTKRVRLSSDLSISAPDESKLIDLVDAKYNVQIHSVISSSKIQKKVSSVLRHLACLTTESPTESHQKPHISVLRAKASDAGKLVSIAEIVKREIEAQQDGSAGSRARWFQYTGLGQGIKETPREKIAIVEETILGGVNQEQKHKEHVDQDESDEDDNFEYMKTPFERAIEGKPKKQTVAIMNLFLARVSIDELKRRYGEDTNEAHPARMT